MFASCSIKLDLPRLEPGPGVLVSSTFPDLHLFMSVFKNLLNTQGVKRRIAVCFSDYLDPPDLLSLCSGTRPPEMIDGSLTADRSCSSLV